LSEKNPKDDLSQTAAEGAEQVNSFGKEYQNKNKYSPKTLSLSLTVAEVAE
jgi:hypothetical protein